MEDSGKEAVRAFIEKRPPRFGAYSEDQRRVSSSRDQETGRPARKLPRRPRAATERSRSRASCAPTRKQVIMPVAAASANGMVRGSMPCTKVPLTPLPRMV